MAPSRVQVAPDPGGFSADADEEEDFLGALASRSVHEDKHQEAFFGYIEGHEDVLNSVNEQGDTLAHKLVTAGKCVFVAARDRFPRFSFSQSVARAPRGRRPPTRLRASRPVPSSTQSSPCKTARRSTPRARSQPAIQAPPRLSAGLEYGSR